MDLRTNVAVQNKNMDLGFAFFVLFIFSIPFFSVSPWQEVASVPVGYIYVGIVVVNYLFLIGSLGLKRFFVQVVRVPLFWLMMLFLTVNVLSVLVNFHIHQYSRDAFVELGYRIFSIGVYILCAMMINRKNVRQAVNFYLVASVLAAAYGLYETIGYLAGFHTGQIVTYLVPRLYGTATEPQVFGNFLLSCLPLVLCLYFMESRGRVRWAVPLFILLLALVMTISVGASAGMLGSLLFIILFFRRFTLKGVSVFLLIIVLISGVIWSINRFAEPNYLLGLSTAYEVKMLNLEPQYSDGTPKKSVVVDNKRSYVDRVWFRQAAWNMFKDNPIIGVGTGNYGSRFNQYRSEGTPELDFNVKTHNEYLNILSETGIIGFGVFAAIIFTLLFKAFTGYFETGPENKTIIIGLVACVIGLGIHAYSFGVLKHNYTWVVAGFLAAAVNRQDKLL